MVQLFGKTSEGMGVRVRALMAGVDLWVAGMGAEALQRRVGDS